MGHTPNPTDIISSLDTHQPSRYDDIQGIAPHVDLFAPGDERNLPPIKDEDGNEVYAVFAPTEPGDVEGRELEAHNINVQSQTVASVVGASSHPFSQGHEEVKAPQVHDLLNPKEGGKVLDEEPDPDAEVTSIEANEEHRDRAELESQAADAGLAVSEGNAQDILRAEGSGDDHTVSTGLDDPQTEIEPKTGDPVEDTTVIDVTSEASGPDGVVTGEDAEESIEARREENEQRDEHGNIVVDESGAQVPPLSAGEVPEEEGASKEEGDGEGDETEASTDPLPEGWEELTNDEQLDLARDRGIEDVNTTSNKPELIKALKKWEKANKS